jgi:type IV pilus assembly protein PilV
MQVGTFLRGPAVSTARYFQFQTGFSLIEVLIALLVISVGVLGVAGMQASGLRNNASAYHRTQANALAYDLLDSMRSNRAAALSGEYAKAPPGDVQAAADLASWKASLFDLLPSGTGAVTCDTSSVSINRGSSVTFDGTVCQVTVSWDDTRSGDPGNFQSVLVSTQI